MNLFQDEDGSGFHVFASEDNRTIHVSQLSDDYLRPSGQSIRTLEGRSREAPAVFKRHDKYYLITSGCTGWDPNAAEYAVARSILGPWEGRGNPCRGPESDRTFGAQSTFVFPVAGRPGKYVFMADIWNKHDLCNSRYAWLPVRFDGAEIIVEWLDEWDLEIL